MKFELFNSANLIIITSVTLFATSSLILFVALLWVVFLCSLKSLSLSTFQIFCCTCHSFLVRFRWHKIQNKHIFSVILSVSAFDMLHLFYFRLYMPLHDFRIITFYFYVHFTQHSIFFGNGVVPIPSPIVYLAMFYT